LKQSFKKPKFVTILITPQRQKPSFFGVLIKVSLQRRIFLTILGKQSKHKAQKDYYNNGCCYEDVRMFTPYVS
jgi:hypothetical protein